MDVADPPPDRDVICSISEQFFQAYSCNPVSCCPHEPCLWAFLGWFCRPKGLSRLLQGSSSAPLYLLQIHQAQSHMHGAFRLSISYKNLLQKRRSHSFHQVSIVSSGPHKSLLGSRWLHSSAWSCSRVAWGDGEGGAVGVQK